MSLDFKEKAFEGITAEKPPSTRRLSTRLSHNVKAATGPTIEPALEPKLPTPPDGGLHAWLKVVGGFLIYINIWGFTLTFGAFQTYYKHDFLSDSNASAISWIGTVQAWLLISVGVLTGPLFDLGYFRSMLYLGNFLVVFGIMMLSLCKEYWQVFLAQGVCMGLGAGLLYIPSLALVGIWFQRKRALAMGFVMSGIAVGGIIYILMFDRLTKSTGFPWAIRAMGFIALFAALLSFPALLSGSSILARPRKARRLFDKTALKDKLFIIFTFSTFFTFLGYIVPYFYIPSYAQDKLGTSGSTALYSLVVSVAGSFFGRLGSGVLAHYLGSTVTWILCSLARFFSAGLVTLPSAAFANICPDLSLLGTRLGMSWGVSSIASLIGAPIAGALIKTKNGHTDFIGVQVWSGTCLLLGTCWLFVLWVSTVRVQKSGWWI
ncbi:MFS general substrate transporter [Lindgomyces ingoldianus]|uniref:MFS general substrate transporter n=1 Tax=Lindgomyces ingoldianus TaxID=673940 RepID=A0ACB6RDJ9_9PLEO|nr:MFS general substrate transporter [Lindgomyces ingoldianus]KAF2476390.1 MFS general substrate transporter [Lindgomyces ingoldianus]